MKRVTISVQHLADFSRHPVWLMVVVWPLGGSLVAEAQPKKEPSAAVQMGSAAGTRRYRSGAWGVVGVSAVNPTNEAAELLAAVYFADDPTFQFGRKIWVPAQSILSSTCPIFIPESRDRDATHVNVVSVSVDQADGTDAHGRSHSEAMDQSKPLIVNNDQVAVGILGDFKRLKPEPNEPPFYTGPDVASPFLDDAVYDLVLTAMLSEGLSRRLSVLNAWELPADAACLDTIDVLVLCSDRLADDPDATALVRNWVLGGGYLWVLLDDVEQESVSEVLGDVFTPVVVDRVKLTELQIEDSFAEQQIEEGTSLEFDEPVAFARVVPGDVTVTDTVDGWPAAFWLPFGDGKVFCTTLGPRAWFRPITSDDAKPQGINEGFPLVARKPLARFASHCFSGQRAESFDVAAMEPFLAKQIGYRIIGREFVTIILAIFCGVLCVVGTGLWRIGRLDRLLWVGPAAAAGASLVFLGVAAMARNSVPPTVAIWQRVTFEPGVATGQARGLTSLYNPEVCDSEIGATRGGLLIPDMTAMRGERRRMVWTDEGRWHWEDLKLPPGVRTAPTEHVVHLEETVECRARFGPSGLIGSVAPLPFKGIEDAVIATPGQVALATRIRTDGSFDSGAGDVLARDEFVPDTWLSDVQQRRTDVYRLVLKRRPDGIDSARPVLHFWTDPLDAGFEFPQTNRLGSALISMPIQMDRSIAGSEVTVPSPFIPFRGIIGPDGSRPASFNSLTKKWGELAIAATEWLRFQMPETVLPLELSQATVSLDIRAPSRLVEILCLRDGAPVVVNELTHPIGTFETVLDRPAVLQLDEQGGVAIGIRVSSEESADSEDLMGQATWKVESLQMSIVGTVRGD